MPGLLIGGRGRVGGSDAQRGAEHSGSRRGNQGRTRGVCIRREPGVWRLAPGRHRRLDAHAVDTCASAQDWLSSRAGPALGGRGRKAGSGDGPAGRPAAFGWLALQGGPGARAPRALILCLSGFRARRCFWHLKSGRQVLAAQTSSSWWGEAGGVGVRPPGTGDARSENRVKAGGEDAGRGLGRGHTHQSAGPPDSRLSSV